MTARPLIHPLPPGAKGWWSKLELCRPDLEGDIFALDLDSTVLGPIAHLATVGKTTLLRDFYRPHTNLQSSVMYLTESDRRRLWQVWRGNEAMIVANYAKKGAGFNGDQNFIQDVLGIGPDVARWQDEFPGEFASYKVNRVMERGGVVDPCVKIVVFHGKPRPWDVAPVAHSLFPTPGETIAGTATFL